MNHPNQNRRTPSSNPMQRKCRPSHMPPIHIPNDLGTATPCPIPTHISSHPGAATTPPPSLPQDKTCMPNHPHTHAGRYPLTWPRHTHCTHSCSMITLASLFPHTHPPGHYHDALHQANCCYLWRVPNACAPAMEAKYTGHCVGPSDYHHITWRRLLSLCLKNIFRVAPR